LREKIVKKKDASGRPVSAGDHPGGSCAGPWQLMWEREREREGERRERGERGRVSE
jgi:hypothetical protein